MGRVWGIAISTLRQTMEAPLGWWNMVYTTSKNWLNYYLKSSSKHGLVGVSLARPHSLTHTHTHTHSSCSCMLRMVTIADWEVVRAVDFLWCLQSSCLSAWHSTSKNATCISAVCAWVLSSYGVVVWMLVASSGYFCIMWLAAWQTLEHCHWFLLA